MIKILVGLLALLLIYPLINEETSSACHAVEKRTITEIARTSGKQDMGAAFMLGLAGEVSNGVFASGAVKTMYPNIPPVVGCFAVYYQMTFDPAYTRQIVETFGSKLR